MNEYGNTLGDHIIAFFGSARSTKIYYRILRERAFERRNKGSMRSALYRLEKQGYIEKGKEGWRRTSKKYEKTNNRNSLEYITSPFDKTSPNYAIISFDIPEKKRYARTWIRNQIKIFGYKMIQQSVWIGPGPLPKKFSELTKLLEVSNCIRVFKLAQDAKIVI